MPPSIRNPAPLHSRAVRDMCDALQQEEMTGTRTGSGARCSLTPTYDTKHSTTSPPQTLGDEPRRGRRRPREASPASDLSSRDGIGSVAAMGVDPGARPTHSRPIARGFLG